MSNQQNKKPSAIDEWFESGNAPLLREVINSPVLLKALGIIEARMTPNDVAIQAAARQLGPNASFAISSSHSVSAGVFSVRRWLERLAGTPPEKLDQNVTAEPMEHYDETYLDQK